MYHFLFGKIGFCQISLYTFVEWNDATLNDFEHPDSEQHFETTFFRSDVWHNLANLDAMTYVETQSKCRDETKFSFILNLFKIQGKLSLVSNLIFQNVPKLCHLTYIFCSKTSISAILA